MIPMSDRWRRLYMSRLYDETAPIDRRERMSQIRDDLYWSPWTAHTR